MLTEIVHSARLAAQQGNWGKVEELALLVEKRNPGNPESQFLFGLIEKTRSRPFRAISHFEKVLSINPNRYDAAIELANQLAITQKNSEAAKVIRNYAPLLENSPLYLDLSGTILSDIGLTEEALPFYERAIKLQPDIELFQGNLAACYNFLGKLQEAKAIYKNLLKKQPNHQRNHYRLSRLHKAQNYEHVAQMEKIVANEKKAHKNNIFIYYAIGKELEDLGDWDKSFHYYKLAGDAATDTAQYSLQEDLSIIDQAIDSCTLKWLSEKPARNFSQKKIPIFIVGLPRTGTTLTERILSSHSKVQSLGETQFIPMSVRKASNTSTRIQLSEEIIRDAAKSDAAQISNYYQNSIEYRLDHTTDYYIEKLPYNFLLLGFIAKAFPNSKIVLLKRNPVDSCFSMYKQVFTWAYKYSYNLKNLANYYLKYCELLDHWRQTLGDRIIEINYEQLATDPTRSINTLLEKIQLDNEESCHKFYENRSASTTASSAQIRKKVYSSSVGRWENFSNYLKPLTDIFDANNINYK